MLPHRNYLEGGENMELKPKLKYTPPKLVRIKLDSEQAILATCSTGTVSVSASSTRGCRADPSGCRRFNRSAGNDSGTRS